MWLRRNLIELMFNKVKTDLRKYDHVDTVDDILKNFFKSLQKTVIDFVVKQYDLYN